MDQLERLWGLVLSPGQESDHRHAPELAKEAIAHNADTVMGDKGYDSDALRELVTDAGLTAIIPYRKCRKVCPEIDIKRYKERNVIERFIGKIKENRRVATRYDKKATHFAGFITLAAIKLWLKTFC